MRNILLGLLLFFVSTVTFASETDQLVNKCIDKAMTEIVRNKLVDAEIIATPFPHFIIEDTLFDRLYEAETSEHG